MKTPLALALLAAAIGCGTPHPRAPVALGRPGPEPGSREFLVDDLLFVGPDWPSRVEGTSAFVEEDGPCREKRFVGPSAQPWTSPFRGPTYATSCTFVGVMHARALYRSRAECEQAIEEEVPYGAFRYASRASRRRVDLGGRAATEDDLLYYSGSEARRYVSYAVCWGEDLYALTIGGLDARWDEVERIRARILATSRWVDPTAARAAGAAAPAGHDAAGR